MAVKLGVNIDHVATLRQARGTDYPDPVSAAQLAIEAGATGITMHLREDRRHIQDHDVLRMRAAISAPLNLEMAVTDEMIAIACEVKPAHCCLVPEKREELTTEGGLDVLGRREQVTAACQRLAAAGIEVSLFIDPEPTQIEAAARCGAPVIELHTGTFADAATDAEQENELARLMMGAQLAHSLGLIVNAGHGLTCENVQPIAALPHMNELNIGHSLIADSVFLGLDQAVKAMLQCMKKAL